MFFQLRRSGIPAVSTGGNTRLAGAALAALFAVVAILAASPAAAEGILDLIVKENETAAAKDGAKVRLYGASKALVIGIDTYTEQGWPKLSMAIRDAEEVSKALHAQGFKVTLVKDLKSDDLDRTFRDFFINEGADPEARLLVWFAGHGHTVNGEGYLVPADGPHPQADVAFRRKALSLRRFGEYMREARAKHVLAVFDSCFAGTVFNVARAAPPPAITLSTALPVRQFVSSGEAEQEVSDDGTFRKLFIDALDGKEPAADANKDGYITGSELGQFLFDKVTNLTGQRQTPRYGKLSALGYDRGDFVMETKKLVAPPVVATPSPAGDQPTALGEAAVAWGKVDGTNAVPVLEAYARQFPGTVYAALAQQQLEKLKAAEAAKQAVEATQKKSDAEARAKADAERQQLAMLQKQEADRKAVAPKPGETFRDCEEKDAGGNFVCPEMVVVPAGSFTMGSSAAEIAALTKVYGDYFKDEGPQRKVTIPAAFAVGKYEVTWAEWEACVAAGACDNGPVAKEGGDEGWGKGRRPVINVSWNDAKAYAAWLSKTTRQTYRLPTEAEWEYAARAGTTGAFSFDGKITTDKANYDGNYTHDGSPKGKYRQQTVPVDEQGFPANPWGLYHVHGNIWEWVEDCKGDYKDAPSDGRARTSGDCSSRVLRGGSWDYFPRFLRSAYRFRYQPDNRFWSIGFRLARTLNPTP